MPWNTEGWEVCWFGLLEVSWKCLTKSENCDFSWVYTPLPFQQVFVNAHLLCKLINEMKCDISCNYILPEADE